MNGPALDAHISALSFHRARIEEICASDRTGDWGIALAHLDHAIVLLADIRAGRSADPDAGAVMAPGSGGERPITIPLPKAGDR